MCLYVFWYSILQKLVIVPSKKDLGLAFKGNQKMVLEALEVTNLVIILVSCYIIICAANFSDVSLP